jgi:exoribonuclease-2
MILTADGTIEDDIEFFAATIESKAKLAYDNVSDWLENTGSWQPESESIAQQITLLQDVCLRRSEWRKTHALVFKDRPDYRFVLGEKAKCWISLPNRAASPTALSKSR